MKIICIGMNYHKHVRELGSSVPEVPVFFMKPDSALVIGNKPFFYPDFSSEVHYEIEIVLKITRLGRSIQKTFASRYFTEIGLGVDFTARDIQRECRDKGLPWEIAKGFDYSAVVSRFLPVTDFPAINELDFRLDLNGRTVQEGNSKDMIFSFEEIISYVSRFMTLKTGDLIYTGTPEGVGPVKIGDRLEGYLGTKRLLDFPVK